MQDVLLEQTQALAPFYKMQVEKCYKSVLELAPRHSLVTTSCASPHNTLAAPPVVEDEERWCGFKQLAAACSCSAAGHSCDTALEAPPVNRSLLPAMEMDAVRVDGAGASSLLSATEADDTQLLAPHQLSRRPFPGLPVNWGRPCTIATIAAVVACLSLMLVVVCFLRPHAADAWPPSVQPPTIVRAPCEPVPTANSSMYPAVRARAAATIRSLNPTLPPNTWAFLVGGQDSSLGFSDTEVPFRQESNFLYLTGWNMSGAMALFSVDDGSLHLLLQVCVCRLSCLRISRACRSGPTQTRCGTEQESPLNLQLHACAATCHLSLPQQRFSPPSPLLFFSPFPPLPRPSSPPTTNPQACSCRPSPSLAPSNSPRRFNSLLLPPAPACVHMPLCSNKSHPVIQRAKSPPCFGLPTRTAACRSNRK